MRSVRVTRTWKNGSGTARQSAQIKLTPRPDPFPGESTDKTQNWHPPIEIPIIISDRRGNAVIAVESGRAQCTIVCKLVWSAGVLLGGCLSQ